MNAFSKENAPEQYEMGFSHYDEKKEYYYVILLWIMYKENAV